MQVNRARVVAGQGAQLLFIAVRQQERIVIPRNRLSGNASIRDFAQNRLPVAFERIDAERRALADIARFNLPRKLRAVLCFQPLMQQRRYFGYHRLLLCRQDTGRSRLMRRLTLMGANSGFLPCFFALLFFMRMHLLQIAYPHFEAVIQRIWWIFAMSSAGFALLNSAVPMTAASSPHSCSRGRLLSDTPPSTSVSPV